MRFQILKNQLMIQRKIYNTNLKLIKRENPSMIIVINDYNELNLLISNFL